MSGELKQIFEETEEVVEARDLKIEQKPERGSAGWTEFLISKLEPHEHIDGYPKIDGLRRLTEKYIGNIVRAEFSVIQPPYIASEEKKHKLDFGDSTRHVYIVHPAVIQCVLYLEDNQVYSGIADASLDNTPASFATFLTAMAEVRAEVRALRRALRLSSISYEEQTSSVKDSNLKMTDSQKAVLDTILRRIDIDTNKFLKHHTKGEDWKKIPQTTAIELIKQSNEYQRNTNTIPEEIKL